jgi:hypothetical protein
MHSYDTMDWTTMIVNKVIVSGSGVHYCGRLLVFYIGTGMIQPFVTWGGVPGSKFGHWRVYLVWHLAHSDQSTLFLYDMFRSHGTTSDLGYMSLGAYRLEISCVAKLAMNSWLCPSQLADHYYWHRYKCTDTFERCFRFWKPAKNADTLPVHHQTRQTLSQR